MDKAVKVVGLVYMHFVWRVIVHVLIEHNTEMRCFDLMLLDIDSVPRWCASRGYNLDKLDFWYVMNEHIEFVLSFLAE